MLILLIPFFVECFRHGFDSALGIFVWIIVIVGISLGVPLLLAVFTKLLFPKNRPIPTKRDNLRQKIYAGSFPSNHTIVVVVVASLVWSMWRSWWIFLPYLLIAILVVISRVKLKKHYRIDVLGGLLYAPVGFLLLAYFAQRMTAGGSGS
jgi:membrane-associated phospholipid phosphatase